jgi:hypothetical protein
MKLFFFLFLFEHITMTLAHKYTHTRTRPTHFDTLRHTDTHTHTHTGLGGRASSYSSMLPRRFCDIPFFNSDFGCPDADGALVSCSVSAGERIIGREGEGEKDSACTRESGRRGREGWEEDRQREREVLRTIARARERERARDTSTHTSARIDVCGWGCVTIIRACANEGHMRMRVRV